MSAHNDPSVPDVDQLARSMLALHGVHGAHEAPARRQPRESGPRSPDLATDPDRAAALREATRREHQRYLNWGLQPVDCRFCHASVLVRKLGPGHTSVQWSSESMRRCAFFAQVRRAGGETARVRSCPKLADSIDHAIAEGIVEPVPSAPPPGDG
ncbi:hypothetical protein [Mycobacterium botniense]|uniref:hypothetical protein n=1 Tax=Mycobacterium botniense TaxID=84962 RepID=UPI0013D847B7|nr:hypothetical protein [Mycobacterium botniense]